MIKIRKFNIKEHNIYEYIIILIYISYENGIIILIRWEIYIIDNFFTKTFINIDIIKSENIIFDINKNLIIIKLYNFLRVKRYIIVKGFKINAIIINKIRYIILVHSFLIIFIEYRNLLIKRNLIFELN